MQKNNREPNYADDLTGISPEDQASSTVSGSPSLTDKAASAVNGRTDNELNANAEAAGHAESHSADRSAEGTSDTNDSVSQKTGDVTAILEEIEQKRRLNEPPSAANSFEERNANASAATKQKQPKTNSDKKATTGKKAGTPADTGSGAGRKSGTSPNAGTKSKAQNGNQKRKKKRKFTFVDILKYIFPWRGDSLLESIRKIIFFSALVVVGVCTFLISNYYLMLYHSGKEYEEIQNRLAETRSNRGFSEDSYVTDPETGTVVEYLEQNEIADLLLSQNPDLVGYITIPDTEISYPVVQKKSDDISVNTNDYYLNRSFNQETSKAGCIFLDYRCHFDEVVNHRRISKNSDNLVIYGHNMNNRSMFGSLKDYIRNYSYYSEHPIVHLQSLYKNYDYKIFAVFLVDSEDTESEYAFDCWNSLYFNSETEFYDYVNEAKKRNIIYNDVDVTYGDPLLTLYTCNSTVANAKLIVMARMLRTGEDPYEGTENSGYNTNALYPLSYYNNHSMNYDPDLFVPYGPTDD